MICPTCETHVSETPDPCCLRCILYLSDPNAIQRQLRDLDRIAAMHGQPFVDDAQNVRANLRYRITIEREGGPALTASDMLSADSLTKILTTFDSFLEMAENPAGYWPKLNCSRLWERFPGRRNDAVLLANLYDRYQAARKDPRRAARLGIVGL